jgi:hypothetical protein
MLGVAASTLTRRNDLSSERRGERDRVLAPAEVLRLGAIYRKRSLDEVAQDLIEHARGVSPQDGTRIEVEIEALFEARLGSEQVHKEIVEEARRRLGPEAAERIRRALSEPGEPLPEAFSGNIPPPD